MEKKMFLNTAPPGNYLNNFIEDLKKKKKRNYLCTNMHENMYLYLDIQNKLNCEFIFLWKLKCF